MNKQVFEDLPKGTMVKYWIIGFIFFLISYAFFGKYSYESGIRTYLWIMFINFLLFPFAGMLLDNLADHVFQNRRFFYGIWYIAIFALVAKYFVLYFFGILLGAIDLLYLLAKAIG